MKRAPSSQFPDLPSVTVKPHGQKRLDHGHPWVYSNEVEMDAAAKAVPPGGLVRLCAAQGRYRATAFFNRPPLIAARVLTQIGRAHVCTTVTNAQLVCRLLLDK